MQNRHFENPREMIATICYFMVPSLSVGTMGAAIVLYHAPFMWITLDTLYWCVFTAIAVTAITLRVCRRIVRNQPSLQFPPADRPQPPGSDPWLDELR